MKLISGAHLAKMKNLCGLINKPPEAKKQEPEPDDLTIAYMNGLYDGKKMRQWVGLTEDDWDEIFGNALTIGEAIKVTEAKLKEKNT